MKKCPYCAEPIQKEAIVCRYCGKNLVDNVEAVATERKQKEFKGLTLDDLSKLNEKWNRSYVNLPKKATENILGLIRKFMMEDMSKIFAEYFRYKMIDDLEYQKILMQITGISFQWALVCFEIGIEGGKKRIAKNDIPKYCTHVSKPYRDVLATWVIRLSVEGKIGIEQGNALIQVINDGVFKLVLSLGNLGFIYCDQVESKGDGMEFFKAIKQIYIDV